MDAPTAFPQMLELILLGIIGVLAGVFTGLTPGIHPNTVIFGSIPVYFSLEIQFMSYAAFISGMSISHTFHDFLPAIYLQAPDANTALSTMPGAEKAANGSGPEAFHSTLLGGIISITLVSLAIPLLFLFLKDLYVFLEPAMGFIVLFFLFFLIFENELIPSLITSFLAGTLGLIALNSDLAGNFILMPVFTGLFAVPAITSSLTEEYEMPEQDFTPGFHGVKGSFAGSVSGLIAGTVPGVGAAASTTFLSPIIDDESDFLAGMGGVNTTDIVISFIALLTIQKARSGASVVLQSLKSPVASDIFILVGLSVFCGGFSALLALRTEKAFVTGLNKISFRYVALLVLVIVVLVAYALSGFFGLLTLGTASFIGFYSMKQGCRACCMAVLLIPSILFFL